MRVLITGAAGFIGSALVRRLLQQPCALTSDEKTLTLVLVDKAAALERLALHDQRVRCHDGDMSDPSLLRRALADGIDIAFHLASVPGGTAERDYELGRRVNLDATLMLFDQLAEQKRMARVVFASSIAVYGGTLPAVVDQITPLHPLLSYGAHKLAAEIMLADLTRRGRINGISLRLPGIVTRPPAPSGLASAYMSDVIRCLAAGQPCICPVSPQATSWWLSVNRCVDNLLHAAQMPTAHLDPGRAWPLPVLHLSMMELVAALASAYGQDRSGLIRYEPVETLEAIFGRYPPLDNTPAEALGFLHDGSPENLVRNALATY